MILVRFEYHDNSKRSLEKQMDFEMIPAANEYILLEGNRVRVVRKTNGYDQQKIFILIEVLGAEE